MLLTFLVFAESDVLIAQCVEHDICVHGKDMEILLDRINHTLAAERKIGNEDLSHTGVPLADVIARIEQRVKAGAAMLALTGVERFL